MCSANHSGRAAFRERLRALGYADVPDDRFNDAFTRFKDLADRKKTIFDEDIVALVDDEIGRDHDRIRFVALEIWAGSRRRPRAAIELEVDGAEATADAEGDGPVDATFRALHQAFRHNATLKLFSVAAVTEGTDAQAPRHRPARGKRQAGRRPRQRHRYHRRRRPRYIHALNKLLVKRARTAPDMLSA